MSEPIFLGCTTPEQDARLLESIRKVREGMTQTPTKPGFYWARWLTAAEGTHEGDELTPATNWEIVEVWENFIGEPCEADADEKFGVSVTGVRETQWLKNFRWDVGPSGKCEPIPEPGMEE